MSDQLIQFIGSLIAILLISFVSGRIFQHQSTLSANGLGAAVKRLFNEQTIHETLFATDKKTALLRLADGQLILARSMGRDVACRALNGADFNVQNGTLYIDPHDYTMPAVSIVFAEADRALALSWLEHQNSI